MVARETLTVWSILWARGTIWSWYRVRRPKTGGVRSLSEPPGVHLVLSDLDFDHTFQSSVVVSLSSRSKYATFVYSELRISSHDLQRISISCDRNQFMTIVSVHELKAKGGTYGCIDLEDSAAIEAHNSRLEAPSAPHILQRTPHLPQLHRKETRRSL